MCNDNLAPDVQTLEFALQRRNHYPADKYCGKQLVIRWIAACVAWHGGFGWARYVIKVGEGRETARRLGRFAASPLMGPARQNRHATQATG